MGRSSLELMGISWLIDKGRGGVKMGWRVVSMGGRMGGLWRWWWRRGCWGCLWGMIMGIYGVWIMKRGVGGFICVLGSIWVMGGMGVGLGDWGRCGFWLRGWDCGRWICGLGWRVGRWWGEWGWMRFLGGMSMRWWRMRGYICWLMRRIKNDCLE